MFRENQQRRNSVSGLDLEEIVDAKIFPTSVEKTSTGAERVELPEMTKEASKNTFHLS